MAYLLGVDINNAAIAEDGAVFGMNPARTYHHDMAINPIIFWGMLIGCIYFLVLVIKKKVNKIAASYFIPTISSMVIFCVFLRWERFIERYTIAYLAIFSPAIALLINICKTEKKKCGDMLAGILIFVSLVELVNMIPYHISESTWSNGSRSIEYFHNWKEDLR